MDSRDSPHHHHHNHHQHHQQIHHHQQQHQQQPFPHGLMNSYGLPNNHSMSNLNSGNMMNPNFRYPFNHIMSSAAAATNSKPFDSSITNNNSDNNSDNHNKSSMSNNGLLYDSALAQSSFSLEQQSGEKKKRGRPRKCAAEGSIALGLSSAPPPPPQHSSIGDDDFSPVAVSAPPPTGESPVKRGRGRPPGSGKKQLDALGPGGVGFTPHVIMCQPGEDIASKIVAFSRQATRTVCILSANGAISSVTLKQPSSPCGTVTYEERFQIISLSGSFTFSESNGDRSRNGGLTISFAGKDDQVLGGSVAGALMAATPVQVILSSFAPDMKKPNSNTSASKPSSGPPGQTLNFRGPMAAGASPSSNGDGSNDSSEENGSSPLNGPAYAQTYNNGTQPIHGIPYHAMNWPPNR